jgi:hypothetical protein
MFVNPRSEGEVVSAGIADNVAKRFEPKMNSLMTCGLKIWLQVTAPCWLRVRSEKPEPTGTLPPLDAPLTILNGYASLTSSMIQFP